MTFSIFSAIPQIYQIIFLALLAGFLIGLERLHEERKMVGIRVFMLVAVINAVSAYMAILFAEPFAVISLSATFIFSLFTILAKKLQGNFTTSLAIFLTGLIGILLGYGNFKAGLALVVLLPMILILKSKFAQLLKWKTYKKVIGLLQVLVLAFVLLPILPGKPVDPWGLLNLRALVLIIIAVAVLQFISFIIVEKWKSRGLMMSGALVGLIDSDVINGAMASIVKKVPKLSKSAALAIVSGNLSMLVRNLVIVGSLNLTAMYFLLPPMATMLIAGTGLIFWNLKKAQKIEDFNLDVANPFELKTAVRFAVVIVFIGAVAFIARQFFGDAGLYVTAFFGALLGDAAVTAAAVLLGVQGQITFLQVAIMVMITSFVSSLNDIVVQYLTGAKTLARDLFKVASLIVIAGLIVLIVEIIIMS